ncbi:hypothetical protein NX059_008085 [Plenodomus lindquistii]|nr:hypothetical protein NX059_008085 [Plenodomus lindquistii]
MAFDQPKDILQIFQTIKPPVTPSSRDEDVYKAACSLPTLPRFLHLLRHAKDLIATYGPYTKSSTTATFIRATVIRDGSSHAAPAILARSLAAAQDCIDSAQPPGLANEDLIFFSHLWTFTLAALGELLEAQKLDVETIGWGVIGLCAGYMNPGNEFQSYEIRLRTALKLMPSMDKPNRGSEWAGYRSYMRSKGTTVRVLATARSEIHACTTMLLQRFAREDWKTIRWYHGIAVAERWVSAL